MFKLFLPVSKRGMRWRKDSTIDKQIIEKQFLLTLVISQCVGCSSLQSELQVCFILSLRCLHKISTHSAEAAEGFGHHPRSTLELVN